MSDHSYQLASIEQIIEDAKNGKMFILVDDEDRENEGDLVIPAQMADEKAVNFMAKYGRGLICLAMDKQRIAQLDLPPMARHNGSRHQTAFTVSIEAREGITTGISAADRAQTIATAIDPEKNASHITTPGHVFPLEAREGGVLIRAGHTEAAVDISRIAGLNPSGVICEIMNDDGTMARLPQLIEFAKQHHMNVATIADLISYRRRHETLVKRHVSTPIHTEYGGEFEAHIYVNTLHYAEHIALVKGTPSPDSPVLVRMHALDMMADILGDTYGNKNGQLQNAMRLIEQQGSGIIVLLREPRKDSVSTKLKARSDNIPETIESNIREYGVGAQILLDLGVRQIDLMTNSPKTIIGLEGYGLAIKNTTAIPN